MTICARAACDNPVTDTTVCRNCVDALMSALGGVPALVTELETAITRQTRLGGGNGRRGRADTAPLPVDLRAAEVAHRLRAELVSCVRHLWAQGAPRRWACRDCGLPREEPGPHTSACDPLVVWRSVIPPVDCEDTVEAMAGWLSRRPNWIAGDEIGGDLVDDLLAVIHSAWRTVDRPPGRLYAGPCNTGDCTADLYHRLGAQVMTCPACGAIHTVQVRQRWIVETSASMLLDVDELSALATVIGHRMTPSAVRNAAARRQWPRIAVPGYKTLYRVADLSAWLKDRELAAAGELTWADATFRLNGN